MDIYFCDECGARVTDLDLRAGKGMRRRHDTICPACVDQGMAPAWLSRSGAQAAVGASAPSAPPAAVAVAEAPDPISLARDRAITRPDDGIDVAEPAPLRPIQPAAKAPVPETVAVPAPDTDRLAASGAKALDRRIADGLASAGGGFDALVGPPPATRPLDDEPEETPGPEAKPDSPFGFVHPKDQDNPAKTETAEVDPAPPSADDAAKGNKASARSGKRTAQGSSRRVAPGKPASKRMGKPPSNKMIYISLASCAVMAIIFFAVVLPGKPKAKTQQTITELPLNDLQSAINNAKSASTGALQSDDLAQVKTAIAAVRAMQEAFATFQSKAGSRWDEEAHGEQLRRMGYYEVNSLIRPLNERKFILESRAK